MRSANFAVFIGCVFLVRRSPSNLAGITVVIASRLTRGEASLWQRRFWMHAIMNQEDLNCHIDYIHYNPVKHGYVKQVIDWEWSSFHRYTRHGLYEPDWGQAEIINSNINFG